MTDRSQALANARAAFEADRDARVEQLEARRNLKKALAEAHAAGISDQQLANTFKQVADEKAAYSRARIQQLRTSIKESS